MKKESLILVAAIGTSLLMGCATPYGEGAPSNSALGFTPVTTPEIMVKWSQDFPNIQVLESYVMTVPADTYESIDELPQFSLDLPPGAVFVEPAGGEREMVPSRLIRHTPHSR